MSLRQGKVHGPNETARAKQSEKDTLTIDDVAKLFPKDIC